MIPYTYMWYQNRKLCKSKYPHLVSPISWHERNEIDWPTFALKVEAQEVEVPRTGWLSHYYWCPCSEWGGNPVSLHFLEHLFPKCKQPFPLKHWSGLGWISKSFLPDSWSLLSLTLLLLTRFRLVRIETPALSLQKYDQAILFTKGVLCSSLSLSSISCNTIVSFACVLGQVHYGVGEIVTSYQVL